MSVSDTGPRPRPTDTTYPGAPLGGPTGGPGRRPPAKGRGRWALVAVVILAAIVIGWVLTHRNAPAAGGAGGPPGAAGGRGGGRGGGGMGGVTSVNAAKAVNADVPVYVTALGTVTPAATVTVRTQLAGQLFTVNFREGQMVSKGQVLAQVDPRPYQQALAQAQGNLQRDQATLANAQLDLKRYQTLLAQDSIARQTVDTQAATVRQAQGTVTFDKAAVAAAQLNVNYTRITAPVSGRAGLRQVDAGNYVANGDTNGLVTITQVNPIDVVFTVPEDQIGAVAKGMHAGPVPVTVFDRGQTESLAEGTLLTLDNQIDTTTGTVKAKARFANAGDTLFPNQFVNVRVLVDTLKASVTVPTSAIQRGQNGLFVYTVDNSNTVHMTAVTTGPAVGENTAIASGVQAGTTVVTDGSDRLREGSRVLLPGDCAPGGGAGGRGGAGAGGAAGAGAAGEKPKGNWFTNLFGGKKKDDAATASAAGGAPGAAGAAGGRHRGGAGAAGGQSRQGVGPDGQRCRSVDLSKGPANAMEARTQAMLDQLGLSPDQKAKIQKIRDAGKEKMMAAMQSGDFAAMRAGRTEIGKQMEAVMTPAQRTKYEELRAQMQAQAAAGGFGGGMGGGGMGAPGGAPAAAGAAPATTTASSTTTTTSTTTRGPAPPAGSATATPAAPVSGGQGGAGGGRGAGMFAELGLSPAQQTKIDAIRAEYSPKMRAAYGSGDMATAKSIGEEMRAKMEAVMTPEQRTKAAAIRERMRAQGGGGPGGGSGGAL